MIRFNDPFSNLSNASLNKAAVVNTQIAIMKVLLVKLVQDRKDVESTIATQIIHELVMKHLLVILLGQKMLTAIGSSSDDFPFE